MALGVLLVVGCATGAAVVSTRVDDRVPVLVLARPVTVGQVLTPEDLREVSMAVDAGVAVIESSQASSVVGLTMAVSTPAGAVLSPGMLGEAVLPGPGEAIVAVALPPGAFPPETFPGARVRLVATAAADDPAARDSGSVWVGVVVGVSPTATDATTVVSVQVDEADAASVAAAPAVRLVLSTPGGED